MTAPARLADVLVVVLTPGVTLDTWRRTGLLGREWALYDALRPRFGRIVLLGDDAPGDADIARRLGADHVPAGDADALEAALEGVLGDGPAPGAAIVKTNQHAGGDRAIGLTWALRGRGVQAALVARGGHLRSMNVGRREGFDAATARRAADEEARLFAAADLIVAASPDMAELIRWRYAAPHDRVRVVPNYITPPHAARDERRMMNRILTAGRLAPEKRTHLVIEALCDLPGAELHIVGDGPERAQLRTGAGPDVRFHGAVPHERLIAMMSVAGVFAQMSAYEWAPKTLLEAMGAGCPVVVADAPGLREHVRHTETGLITEAHPEAVREAVKSLLADPRRARAMGGAASAWASERFGLHSIAAVEAEALTDALALAGRAERAPSPPSVRFDPVLLGGPPDDAARAFERAVHGYTKRVEPDTAARMLASLDALLYTLQGEAACAAGGGLHPKHDILRFHDFFTERIGASDRVLDLGAGVGALAASIAERTGARVTCVELNPRNAALARDRIAALGLAERVRVLEGDATTPCAQGGFDVIVLSNILEHLAGRTDLLRNWIEWYGPRRLLIRAPAFERDWRVPWKRAMGVEWRLDPTHEIEHTYEELASELRGAGLVVAESNAVWGEYWVVAEPAAAQAAA